MATNLLEDARKANQHFRNSIYVTDGIFENSSDLLLWSPMLLWGSDVNYHLGCKANITHRRGQKHVNHYPRIRMVEKPEQEGRSRSRSKEHSGLTNNCNAPLDHNSYDDRITSTLSRLEGVHNPLDRFWEERLKPERYGSGICNISKGRGSRFRNSKPKKTKTSQVTSVKKKQANLIVRSRDSLQVLLPTRHYHEPDRNASDTVPDSWVPLPLRHLRRVDNE